MQRIDTNSISQGLTQDQAEVSRVLRNTYWLLSLTLAFSALTAGLAMAINLSYGIGLICTFAAIGLVWFVLPRTANSGAGLGVVFAFTGLIGLGLGPVINHYLAVNGAGLVMQALGGTAFVFLGLSGYALTTRKDFSFLQGFLVMGLWLMIGMMVFFFGASLFGYHFEVLSLVFSAGVILLMSALILFQTSAIIHGGERNYLLATTSLYLAIVNIFQSLLHLLGAADE